MLQRAVFIASAFDKDSPLYQVFFEVDGINSTVNGLNEWKCLSIHKVLLDTVIQRFGNTIETCFQVFHFAGHAIDKALQFNSQEPRIEQLKKNEPYLVAVGGLAKIIRAAHPVQLVFLNGCSTMKQVAAFKAAGIPAVIYTNQPLNDELGNLFAKVFYATFFKENSTLEVAFNMAKAVIEERQMHLSNNGMNPNVEETMKRGIDIFEEASSKELYELSANDDFKKLRWVDWPVPPSTARIIGGGDPQNVESKGIPEAFIHHCNRGTELGAFHILLEELAFKKSNEPKFIFIHEKEHSLPDSLIIKFKEYGISELCDQYPDISKDDFLWKDLFFPNTSKLPNHGLSKSSLFEIYDKNLFKCPFDETAKNFFFEPNSQDKVYVIHHNLTKLNLQDLETPDDFKLLLEFYMDEFSRKVTTELGARLAVLFSCTYFEDNDEFEVAYKSIFESLANDVRFIGRVKNLTEMRPITRQHVGAWKQIVFKGRNEPTPPDVADLFPFIEGEKKTMKEVQGVLEQNIKVYNMKINGQHA